MSKDNFEENENKLSDLDNENNNLRRLQTYLMLIGGGIILVLLLITGVSKLTNSGDKDKDIIKTESTVKVDKKEFTFTPPPPEVKKEEKKLQFEKKSEFKAKIIKGAGGIMTKKQESENTAKSSIDPNAQIEEMKKTNELAKEGDWIGETFVASAATKSEFDQNYLLPKGTYIECSLNTRIVSQVKGGVACTVSNDVYSANGNVLLVEKGSKITGMFKADQMNDGVNRLFVIWQEIRTPNNLVIPVFSGASDPLGGSGIPGYVDHQWMLRFGSAVLLSAVDDVLNVLAYNLNDKRDTGSSIDYTEDTRDNARNMAEIALENFINLKPTLYKNQGDIVGVYVNRDIDFSQVYELKRK